MGDTEGVRTRIIERLARISTIAAAVAFVPSLYASYAASMWLVAAVDSLAFVLFAVVAFSKRLGSYTKLVFLVATSLAIAAAVLYSTGPWGAGYVWLISSIFLASLLGRPGLVVATCAAASALLALYALLNALGAAPYGQPLLTIAVLAANLACVGAMIATTARGLMSGLDAAFDEERRLAARVAEERDAARAAESALGARMEVEGRLLKELNHRVRNNMQVVLSLLALEASGGADGRADGSIERMTRRVRALSRANDLVSSDPEQGTTELHGLVVGALADYRRPEGASDRFAASAFSLGLPLEEVSGFTLALAEILAALEALPSPVRVDLEGPRGDERLTFRWPARAPEEDESLARRICADPFVACLVGPGRIGFEPGSDGRDSMLHILVRARG
jgi:two-component sensor histidine kinase